MHTMRAAKQKDSRKRPAWGEWLMTAAAAPGAVAALAFSIVLAFVYFGWQLRLGLSPMPLHGSSSSPLGSCLWEP